MKAGSVYSCPYLARVLACDVASALPDTRTPPVVDSEEQQRAATGGSVVCQCASSLLLYVVLASAYVLLLPCVVHSQHHKVRYE